MVEAKIAKLLGPRELIFESEHIDENALEFAADCPGRDK